MMKCKFCKENISSFLEGDLKANQKSDYQQHLDQCPSCEKTVLRVRNLCDNLHSLKKKKTSSNFEAILHARIRREAQKNSFFSFRWLTFDNRIQLPVLGVAGALAIALLIVTFQISENQKNNSQNLLAKQPRVVNFVLDEIHYSRLDYPTSTRTQIINNFMTSADSTMGRSFSVQNASVRVRTVGHNQMIAF